MNLSSILGSLSLHSDPKSPIYNGKAFAYDASKTALNAFTVHLAHALRDTKIKVNSAHPGWVKTDMGAPGRAARGLRRGQNQRGAGDATRRRPDRRIFPSRQADSLVIGANEDQDARTRANFPTAKRWHRKAWGESPKYNRLARRLALPESHKAIQGSRPGTPAITSSGTRIPCTIPGFTNSPTGRTTTAQVHTRPSQG